MCFPLPEGVVGMEVLGCRDERGRIARGTREEGLPLAVLGCGCARCSARRGAV